VGRDLERLKAEMTPEARDALLPAIAAGDVQAFASWLATAEPRVRLSLSRFARVVDTEAVLQETLLRLWQVAPRVRIDARQDSLLRLGVQIAHNLAIDHARRSQRRERAAEQQALEQDAELEELPPDPLLRELIRGCVAQLPRQPAAVLTCRLENRGAEADETLAERLGMQLNTFLKNFGRARQFLLECLAKAGVEPGASEKAKA
jgi:RNA polymerase sigma-70 factor (ECF subfamily)